MALKKRLTDEAQTKQSLEKSEISALERTIEEERKHFQEQTERLKKEKDAVRA